MLTKLCLYSVEAKSTQEQDLVKGLHLELGIAQGGTQVVDLS